MMSLTAQYALRAMVALAGLPPGELGCAACIAERASVPANYLSKLLKQLAREGLLVSQKGPHGGFRLARPASDITLAQIVSPLENTQRLASCLMGPAGCTPEHPCPAHEQWRSVREQLLDFLDHTTLAQLLGPA